MVEVNGLYVSTTRVGRLDKLLVLMPSGLSKTVTTPDMEINSELGKGMCVKGNYLIVGEPSIDKTNGRVLIVDATHNVNMQSLSKARVLEPKVSSKTLKGFGSSVVYHKNRLYVLSNGKSLLKDVKSTIHEYKFKAGIPIYVKTHKAGVKVKQLLVLGGNLCADIEDTGNYNSNKDFTNIDIDLLSLGSTPVNSFVVLPKESVEFYYSSVIYNFIHNKENDDYEHNNLGTIDSLAPVKDAMYDHNEDICIYSTGGAIHKCKLTPNGTPNHEC